MSDLQAHLNNLETDIDNLEAGTDTALIDALGEIYFLLDELKTIVTAGLSGDAMYDK